MILLKYVRPERKALLLLILLVIAIIASIVLLNTLENYSVIRKPLNYALFASLSNSVTISAHSITGIVASSGYAGIFLLMILESSSIPIPSELILPFSGYMVYVGQLNFWLTIIVTTVAGICGSLFDYYVGLKGAGLLARQGTLRNLFFHKGSMERVQSLFDRYGVYAIFLGRLVPGVRTLISFPAGAVKMPLSKFVAFTTLGCLVWNVVLIYVGVHFGSHWQAVSSVIDYLFIGVAAFFIVVLIVILTKRKRKTMGRDLIKKTN